MHSHFWTLRFMVDIVVDTVWGHCQWQSTFGRVAYDLDEDIKGFDHHFVNTDTFKDHGQREMFGIKVLLILGGTITYILESRQ